MKRLLSSVLAAILLITTVISVLPVGAGAAYSPSTSVATSSFTPDDYEALYSNVDSYDPDKDEGIRGLYSYKFETPQQMLDYEISRGYISSMTIGNYSLYTNIYTGYVYYKNNVTGQILTTNPCDTGERSYTSNFFDGDATNFTSQLLVKFNKLSDSSSDKTYASSKWAGARGQISVSFIKNGFRVNYTMGDTSSRLLPIAVKAEKFEETLIIPMIEKYIELIESFDASSEDTNLEASEYDFFSDDYVAEKKTSTGYINSTAVEDYVTDTKWIVNAAKAEKAPEYDDLNKLNIAFNQIVLLRYGLKDPVELVEIVNSATDIEAPNVKMAARRLKEMFEKFPITGSWDGPLDNDGMPKQGTKAVAGTAIYAISDIEYEKDYPEKARGYSEIIAKYTDYPINDIVADEKELGIAVDTEAKPIFRCALEYTINEDGTLKVSLPTNSIAFDESQFVLQQIIPLQYFGCGVSATDPNKMNSYALFPDGSGMVTDFTDFETTINHSRPLYGTDYAYSKLEVSYEYLEQVTMPVYGVVTEVKSNSDAEKVIKNGYFAIIEDGSALSTLNMFTDGNTSKYANVYLSYEPYPSDDFDLTETISVGNVTSYTMTLDSKFSGSYVTNITMLTDPGIMAGMADTTKVYESSYSGMAARYRDYLVAHEILKPLDNIQNGSLPLYIETLGSIEVIKKYLTFPVNVNIPLTSFDDVNTMYNELANAKQTIIKMAEENERLAAETPTENPAQKEFYTEKAKEYRELATRIVDMKNVNFKLTGFANDGMNYSYPTKVKWEKACGGKDGFRDLVANAAAASAKEGQNFGVYPEFDFMFLMKEASFDGVKRWDKARMIDNRYASKQIYNPAIREYDKGFGSIINTASLSKLFGKFEDKYSDYEWKYVSLSTFGSSLNSNFDEDDPINREMSLDYVTAVLESASKLGYEIMVDKGNAYTYKYANHIVDLSIDSSHHAYCTYTVPFVGMVLHGYINYAGSAINYSGSVDYEILRSIENGAGLYYILCMQNTNEMKDSLDVNEYYAADYGTWFERVAETYAKLNKEIGNLQDYKIISHKTVIAEKSISEEVRLDNIKKLQNEFIAKLDAQIRMAVNAKLDALKAEAAADTTIKLTVDTAALIAQLKAATFIPEEYTADAGFTAAIEAKIGELKAYFFSKEDGTNVIEINAITDSEGAPAYESDYDYFTNSKATDADYDTTFYSVTNNNVVMVTYSNGTNEVSFVLNYNIDTVELDLGGEPIVLEKYGYRMVEN